MWFASQVEAVPPSPKLQFALYVFFTSDPLAIATFSPTLAVAGTVIVTSGSGLHAVNIIEDTANPIINFLMVIIFLI